MLQPKTPGNVQQLCVPPRPRYLRCSQPTKGASWWKLGTVQTTSVSWQTWRRAWRWCWKKWMNDYCNKGTVQYIPKKSNLWLLMVYSKSRFMNERVRFAAMHEVYSLFLNHHEPTFAWTLDVRLFTRPCCRALRHTPRSVKPLRQKMIPWLPHEFLKWC